MDFHCIHYRRNPRIFTDEYGKNVHGKCRKSHGAPMEMSRHMGDMGNMEADESGKAHLEYTDATILLNGSNSILGRSVIVHKNEDDLKSQPSGNAGPRVACGVIGTAK